MSSEGAIANTSPAERIAGRLGLVILCTLADPAGAPASVIELAQYQYWQTPQNQPTPQYPSPPLYWPTPRAPQYQPPVTTYHGPFQVPRAPVYEPGPYDNYNHGNGP